MAHKWTSVSVLVSKIVCPFTMGRARCACGDAKCPACLRRSRRNLSDTPWCLGRQVGGRGLGTGAKQRTLKAIRSKIPLLRAAAFDKDGNLHSVCWTDAVGRLYQYKGRHYFRNFVMTPRVDDREREWRKMSVDCVVIRGIEVDILVVSSLSSGCTWWRHWPIVPYVPRQE